VEVIPVEQVLVRWSGFDDALAIWEDYTALRQQFPNAAAWGQAASQREGNVSTSQETDSKGRNTIRNEQDSSAQQVGRRLRKTNSRFIGTRWVM
jgi:hypothetical protein